MKKAAAGFRICDPRDPVEGKSTPGLISSSGPAVLYLEAG